MNRALEDIWIDDQIGRQDEAHLISSYVVGASRRARETGARGAITLAVDGTYGVGKTFFLRKLARQLALSHPVAFVDAWADDLADEPLTALVATLKHAIEPLVDEDNPTAGIAGKMRKVMEMSGEVAKIAGLGLLKRVAEMALTAGAVQGIGELVDGVGADIKDSLKDGLGNLSEDAVGGVEKLASVKPLVLMEQRVADFEAGQKAMRDLKLGLAALVNSLDETELLPPIVIIIDELDRCRPTYAIKLLEEIKHLFDVPGLVFIFGMHGQALAASVKAAYGSDFKGDEYLKRFVQRRYVLADKPRTVFIEELLFQSGIKDKDFSWFQVKGEDTPPADISLHQLLNAYASSYELSTRDVEELIDILTTCAALANGEPLILPLLIPLAIGQIKRLPSGTLPEIMKQFQWVYVIYINRLEREDYKPYFLARDLLATSAMTWTQLANMDGMTQLQRMVFKTLGQHVTEPITSVKNYPRLLTMVSNLKINADDAR